MKTEEIIIANLKCTGCENTIKHKVGALDGVKEVTVDHEKDSVKVLHEGKIEREEITKMLHHLGYPEATEENGLLLQLKSYASCIIGRMSD
jgi:copper chaperone